MLNWIAFDFSFLASKTWFSRFTITIAQPDRSRRVSVIWNFSMTLLLLPAMPSLDLFSFYRSSPPSTARPAPVECHRTVRRYAMAACRTPAGALTHLINFVDSWMSLNYHSYKTTHPDQLTDPFFFQWEPWMPLKSSLVQSLPSKSSRLWVDFPLTNSTVQVLV